MVEYISFITKSQSVLRVLFTLSIVGINITSLAAQSTISSNHSQWAGCSRNCDEEPHLFCLQQPYPTCQECSIYCSKESDFFSIEECDKICPAYSNEPPVNTDKPITTDEPKRSTTSSTITERRVGTPKKKGGKVVAASIVALFVLIVGIIFLCKEKIRPRIQPEQTAKVVKKGCVRKMRYWLIHEKDHDEDRTLRGVPAERPEEV